MTKIRNIPLLILLFCLKLIFCFKTNNSVYEKIQFLTRPSDIIAKENDEIRFVCEIIGRPRPVITWSKRDDHIPVKVIITDNSLYINNVTLADEGEYICRGSNNVGTIESSARLIVQAKPVFTEPLFNRTAKSGDNITVACEALGRPKPAVHWSKEDGEIYFLPGYYSESGRLRVTENSELQLYNVSVSHEGLYLCTAINAAGYSTARVYIKVDDGWSNKENMPEFAAKRDESNVASKILLKMASIFLFLIFYVLLH